MGEPIGLIPAGPRLTDTLDNVLYYTVAWTKNIVYGAWIAAMVALPALAAFGYLSWAGTESLALISFGVFTLNSTLNQPPKLSSAFFCLPLQIGVLAIAAIQLLPLLFYLSILLYEVVLVHFGGGKSEQKVLEISDITRFTSLIYCLGGIPFLLLGIYGSVSGVWWCVEAFRLFLVVAFVLSLVALSWINFVYGEDICRQLPLRFLESAAQEKTIGAWNCFFVRWLHFGTLLLQIYIQAYFVQVAHSHVEELLGGPRSGFRALLAPEIFRIKQDGKEHDSSPSPNGLPPIFQPLGPKDQVLYGSVAKL